MTFLSIIIPAYNEENRIGFTLTKINNFFKKKNYSYEIIVVDDGSSDATIKIVKSFKSKLNIRILENKINRGKGFSVKRGILASMGKFTLFTDADLSTPISEIQKLMLWTDRGYNIVIGSRGLPQSHVIVHQKVHRETMGNIFNLLVQSIVIRGIRDTQCGFKYFRGDIGKEIFRRMTIDGFCFDVEAIYIAKQLGHKIKEVPVFWYNSDHSKVKLPNDAFKMLFDLLRIKLMHINEF